MNNFPHPFELVCSQCDKTYPSDELQTIATCCHKPLLARYQWTETPVFEDCSDMWRYASMLPPIHPRERFSLGEGMTPIIDLKKSAAAAGFTRLSVKDESQNPTASFKARGLSMAVTMANHFGYRACVIPTAGNAGGAMSAYCAAAGMASSVIMPIGTPALFADECRAYGSEVIEIDGLIDACGKKAAEMAIETGAMNMSTLKEPYRIEGKKTMGLEIAEQFSDELPDVIIYPTGGGTGLIGIWKAFNELEQVGLLAPGKRPRMIAVQSDVCAPIVDMLHGRTGARQYRMSAANGISVPVAFGADLIKRTIWESDGTAVAVSEGALIERTLDIARRDGILLAPEGGAVFQAAVDLADAGVISRDDQILLVNTGSGLKYLENLV